MVSSGHLEAGRTGSHRRPRPFRGGDGRYQKNNSTIAWSARYGIWRHEGNSVRTKTAETAGLDASFLRRVMQKKRAIGLFTLFKIASASSSTAQDVVGLIAEELRKEVTKR